MSEIKEQNNLGKYIIFILLDIIFLFIFSTKISRSLEKKKYSFTFKTYKI